MKKSNSFNKKKIQLGMDPSTACHKLRMDILFNFVKISGKKCYRCNKELTRDTFSIDHIINWLNSEDPKGLFFNLDNITFSHKSCNYGAARRSNKKYFTVEDRRTADLKIARDWWNGLSKEERKRRRKDKIEIQPP